MNTTNFKSFVTTAEDMLELQLQIAKAYEPEFAQGLEQADIDTLETQELLKKYAWRITEELGETQEAHYHFTHYPTPAHAEHVKEEAVDAFNFLLEFLALAGAEDRMKMFRDDSRWKSGGDLQEAIGKTVYDLTMVCNKLKNRGWRQAQYLVDLWLFNTRVDDLVAHFVQFLIAAGFGSFEDLAKTWSLKYQVNKFRIETKY